MRISIGDMNLQNIRDLTFASVNANPHGTGELLGGITNILEKAVSRLFATQPFSPRDAVQKTFSLRDEASLIEPPLDSD